MAILAEELLVTGAVLAILDDIGAIAFWTMKDYCFADHLPFISPFRKNHYRFFARMRTASCARTVFLLSV